MRYRILMVLACCVWLGTAQIGAPVLAVEIENVGKIDFPNSGSAEAQRHFLRGVGILHSFGWKQAIAEFRRAQAADPGFAMAYWGESLCYNHPLQPERDGATPREVLEKLGATPEERLDKTPTEREKGFLLGVEALFFGDGNIRERRTAHMLVMADLFERYPDDDEVAAFYSLALLRAAGPTGESGHRMRTRSGAIALQLLERNPEHPGAAHYTIHAFDDPVHAPLALPAAFRFADIAASVSHALHMPSHIFIQHGMWDHVSKSNQAAYDAAVRLWQPGDSAGDMVHALDWGQYGDLQRGDYERALLWIERMEAVAEKNPTQKRIVDALPRVKARWVLETRQWQTNPVTDDSTAPELLATGLSAVELGDIDLARKAEQALRIQSEKAESTDPSHYARMVAPVVIMFKQVQAKILLHDGEVDLGLAVAAEAVEIAESMPPPRGAPNPIKPAHEYYAEALLAANRTSEAVGVFMVSLERMPNRPLSLLGMARALVASGELEAAAVQYWRLAEIWKDRGFPELDEANLHLAVANDLDSTVVGLAPRPVR